MERSESSRMILVKRSDQIGVADKSESDRR